MSGRQKKVKDNKSANPGTKEDIDETHSSCGRAASLVGGMTLSIYSISSVSSCLHCHLHVPVSSKQAILTSPFAASDKLPPSSTPCIRKSNGTMWVIPSAVLISWESWKRRHDAGIMNFRGGNWYGVFVVNMTGIEGGRDPSMSIVESKVDGIHAAR